MAGEEIHALSVVVWDVPSAMAGGESFACFVGIKCEAGCGTGGWAFEVRDAAGRVMASGATGDAPWSGTGGLGFGRLELRAPDAAGLHRWQVSAVGGSDAVGSAGEEPATGIVHAGAHADLNLRVVPQSDCRLRVVAVERDSGAPVAGLKVVVHPHRTTTNGSGTAVLDLPRGTYRLFVTGKDFFPFRCDGELEDDTTIRAELEHDFGPSDAEIWS